MRSLFLPVLLGVLLMHACGAPHEEHSDTSFSVSWVDSGEGCPEGDIICRLGFTGHETLVHMAKAQANSVARVDFFKDYGESEDTDGQKSQCPIIRGNFGTDKPIIIKNDFDIKKWQLEAFQVALSEDTHDGPNRQIFHALRNFNVNPGAGESSVWTNQKTCEGVRKVIKLTSRAAADRWKKNTENKEAQYLMGTVTHTIQDSFSKAHSVRNDDTKSIEDICTYGPEIEGICHHHMAEAVTDDFIWMWSTGLLVMKREARLAAYTTAAYLLHMLRVNEQGKDFESEMSDFLDGSPALRAELNAKFGDDEDYEPLPLTGNFRCDASSLKND